MAATTTDTPTTAKTNDDDGFAEGTDNSTGLSEWIALSEQIATALDPTVCRTNDTMCVYLLCI